MTLIIKITIGCLIVYIVILVCMMYKSDRRYYVRKDRR